MFNETIDWRFCAYALIDQSARYHVNISREFIWSVLLVYISNNESLTDWLNDWLTDWVGYLSCTSIKKSYYNANKFYNWLILDLLSLCNAHSTSHSVIIINNNFEHIQSRIKDAIKTYDCRVKYLSFYSSNYNSIELSFKMQKKWVRHYYQKMWSRYDESFEKFLRCAIKSSQCDQFARKHFKHSADEIWDYIFERDI
jgi:hypothetical protein